jgi:hypothetical protein
MSKTIDKEKVSDYLDNLLTCGHNEACARVGIHRNTPYNWLVQSRLGHPDLQDVTFCGVVAPYHIQTDNAKHLAVAAIEQNAVERALHGCMVDVFFQGQRQYETVLKPEYAGKSDDDLAIEIGPDYKRECYHTIPAQQWLKPSDQLVVKILESWKRKRYGHHQVIDVNYGGVLRLEKDVASTQPVIDVQATEVFEDEPTDATEQHGGHLALAAPAKSSEEFEARAAAGEFDQAPVTFRNAEGKPTALRPDIEQLRQQVAELRAHGPKQPYPVDRNGRRTMADLGPSSRDDNLPDIQKPSPYAAPYSPPPARDPQPPARPVLPEEQRNVGNGVEGVGDGPDPERIGSHRGFRTA